MTDDKTTGSCVWSARVMAPQIFQCMYLLLDGYYCQTWKFIKFFKDKNEKGQLTIGTSSTGYCLKLMYISAELI
jgi:hypothetical protein